MLKAANLRPFYKCFRNKGIAEKNIADSTYKQEEHNEVMQFEKLCLNVCPFRRLSPDRSLVISLNLKGLYIYILKHCWELVDQFLIQQFSKITKI